MAAVYIDSSIPVMQFLSTLGEDFEHHQQQQPPQDEEKDSKDSNDGPEEDPEHKAPREHRGPPEGGCRRGRGGPGAWGGRGRHEGGPPGPWARHGGPHGGPPFEGFGGFAGPLGGRGGFFGWGGRGGGRHGHHGPHPHHNRFQEFNPSVDVFDTPANYTIHIALPGAVKEDIGIHYDYDKSELQVSGVVHRPGDEEFLKTLVSSERTIGAFERKIVLGTAGEPASVEADDITAKLENGLLQVVLPKKEKAPEQDKKKIEIE